MAWEWLKDIGSSIGDAVVDWATDPETIDKAVDYFMREEGMTYQDAVKAAQKQAVMNNPNVMSPFGSSITNFDDETGQATVHRVMPQGTLDLVNSLGRRAAGGEINTPRQMGEGSMRQTSQALMDSHARGRGITPTAQNWWEPTPREAVEWTDFTNSYDLGGGSGGSGGTGGVDSGDIEHTEVDQSGDAIIRDNSELIGDYLDDPSVIQDQHRAIFDREGLGEDYDSIRNYYESSRGSLDGWSDFIEGLLTAFGSAGAAAAWGLDWITDPDREGNILKEIEVLGDYAPDNPEWNEFWADPSNPVPYSPTPGTSDDVSPGDALVDAALGGEEDMDLPHSPVGSGGVPDMSGGPLGPGGMGQGGRRTSASNITSYYSPFTGKRISKAEYEKIMAQLAAFADK